MNTIPLILFEIVSTDGFFLKILLNSEANNAKHEHHIKPVMAKVSPKIKNDRFTVHAFFKPTQKLIHLSRHRTIISHWCMLMRYLS